MDHSAVQRMLDHAHTRGIAILFRTVHEMIRDRKMIFVALLSLLPILIGLLWSHYLSEDEDIREERLREVPNTSDLFCYTNIPAYLPDRGNYTFRGQIVNLGDTVQQVSVNMTIGNSRDSALGLRKTTGLMDVAPVPLAGGSSPTENYHTFTITFDMDRFNTGASYIVIQLYVNNTLSSARLIPEEFDWRTVDFTKFRIEDLIGRNMAVYTEAIEIRKVTSSGIRIRNDHIYHESGIMPLTLFYPSRMAEQGSVLHGSIGDPVNGSRVSVSIVNDSGGQTERTFVIMVNGTDDPQRGGGGSELQREPLPFNFTMELPDGFARLGFDRAFNVGYRIEHPGPGDVHAIYQRYDIFTTHVVLPDMLDNVENLSLLLSTDLLYSARFEIPSPFLSDTPNTLAYRLLNNNIASKVFTINITVAVNMRGTGISHHNLTRSFMVPSQGETTGEITLPSILGDEFTDPTSAQDVLILISFEAGGVRSPGVSRMIPGNDIRSLASFLGVRKVSLESRFTPSLHARISIPGDLSTSRDRYNLTGTITNTGAIEKDFEVVLDLQNRRYTSGWFTAGPGQVAEFGIPVPTGELTPEFTTRGTIGVYSSRTLRPTDREAEGTVFLNIIEETHQERQVLQNFLTIYVHLYLKFIVPLVAMVYGISLISMETERRTLGLYLTTPMTKFELILYKFGGYLISMFTLLTIPLILIYFSFCYVLPPGLMVYYLLLLGVCIFDLFLAVAAYGSVFTMIGTIERRPMTIGLSYFMIWEVFVGSLGVFLSQYTLFYHIRCAVLPFVDRYVPNALGSLGLTDFSGRDFSIPMEVSMVVIVCVVFLSLFLAVYLLSSRDVK